MRRQDLTYNERSFLLWCWIRRDADNCCVLIYSNGGKLDKRSIQWYADYFGIPRRTLNDVFLSLKDKNIIKVGDRGKAQEITYVDFMVFN